MQTISQTQPAASAQQPQNNKAEALTASQKQPEHGRLEQIPSILLGVVTAEYWLQLSREQKFLLENLDKLPNELTGIVPESVWSTLKIDQKLQFLFEQQLLSVE